MPAQHFALKVNLITVLLLSVYSNAHAATLYACKSTTGTMGYTSTGCKSPSTEVYHRLSGAGNKNIYLKKTNTTSPTPIATAPTPTPTVTPVVVAPPPVLPTADTVFAKTSFWYTPIPNEVELAVNTVELTNEFVRQKVKYYNNVKVNTYDYAAPVYTVDSTVKGVKVGFNNCQNKTYVDSTFTSMTSAVAIPSYAQPSAGTDGEMAIYQPSTNTYWELWKAKLDTTTGTWSACWGGKISNVSTSNGIFQKGYGTTATGLPFVGGQVTAEELAQGEIKHAIGISLVDTDSAWVISWPANRSDGYNPSGLPNRIAEGQRFRLDPTINVDALSMSKAGKVIAKAAQKYGFVVWDKAGALSIRAQNPKTYTAQGKPDPYPALYENKPTYAVLNGFPWERLQFLPKDYGKP